MNLTVKQPVLKTPKLSTHYPAKSKRFGHNWLGVAILTIRPVRHLTQTNSYHIVPSTMNINVHYFDSITSKICLNGTTVINEHRHETRGPRHIATVIIAGLLPTNGKFN